MTESEGEQKVLKFPDLLQDILPPNIKYTKYTEPSGKVYKDVRLYT